MQKNSPSSVVGNAPVSAVDVQGGEVLGSVTPSEHHLLKLFLGEIREFGDSVDLISALGLEDGVLTRILLDVLGKDGEAVIVLISTAVSNSMLGLELLKEITDRSSSGRDCQKTEKREFHVDGVNVICVGVSNVSQGRQTKIY